MCTMTWFVTDSGYELFFNRDELVSRSRARLPEVHQYDGVTTIAPTDADAGGTWISANQYGVTVCLLNHYQFEQIESYQDWTSRGEMVRRFSATADIGQMEKQFLAMDLQNFRAFRMFAISADGANRLCVWDGHEARVESEVSKPKSSTAVDAKHVKPARRQLFEDSGLAQSTCRQDYLAYHASHQPSKSEMSVCMHRPEANTVSLSHIMVDHSAIEFRYADGPPCEAELGEPISIERVAQKSPVAVAAARV